MVPKCLAASLMAKTSAWAVGSLSSTTRFHPEPTTSPSHASITAPKGPVRKWWRGRVFSQSYGFSEEKYFSHSWDGP